MAMALTVVVLGAVFGLLARGIGTTEVEMARADIQAQQRHGLEQISRDVMQAGRDLPLEFPAFTPPGVNLDLTGLMEEGKAVEVSGNFGNASEGGPLDVVTFDGTVAQLTQPTKSIARGDLVLLYDDEPVNGKWVFGIVEAVRDVFVVLKTAPGDTVDDTTLPPYIGNYNRPAPTSGRLTPITIISYYTRPRGGGMFVDSQEIAARTLVRQLNWKEPVEVALIDELQIRYFVGGTSDTAIGMGGGGGGGYEPFGRRPSEHPGRGNGNGLGASKFPPSSKGAPASGGSFPDPHPKKKGAPPSNELEDNSRESAPVPQPTPSEPLNTDRLVRSVRISVSSSSERGNLPGGLREGHLSSSISSIVAARNVIFKMSNRTALDFN